MADEIMEMLVVELNNSIFRDKISGGKAEKLADAFLAYLKFDLSLAPEKFFSEKDYGEGYTSYVDDFCVKERGAECLREMGLDQSLAYRMLLEGVKNANETLANKGMSPAEMLLMNEMQNLATRNPGMSLDNAILLGEDLAKGFSDFARSRGTSVDAMLSSRQVQKSLASFFCISEDCVKLLREKHNANKDFPANQMLLAALENVRAQMERMREGADKLGKGIKAGEQPAKRKLAF